MTKDVSHEGDEKEPLTTTAPTATSEALGRVPVEPVVWLRVGAAALVVSLPVLSTAHTESPVNSMTSTASEIGPDVADIATLVSPPAAVLYQIFPTAAPFVTLSAVDARVHPTGAVRPATVRDEPSA